VSVVDSQVAEESLMGCLGEKKQVIYSVEDFVTEFDLELRNNYTGPTEFHPCCNLTLSGGTDMLVFWAAN
jgi:hypothetical protein